MKVRVGWFLPVVAVVLTGLALWAGPNVPLALPAAALAVVAAGFLFLGAWSDSQGRRKPKVAMVWEPDVFRLRTAIRSGPLGREEIITTLDRVERMGPTPGLPTRSTDEMNRLTRVSPEEFRRYLRHRLQDLEARM
ncbi:MAG TPA: hypothetical protein VMF04_02740 [Thermoplasmata archaeon]|nr:hypothetical protein [Thermoplasmata archaeon]